MKNPFPIIKNFSVEIVQELRKSSWPTVSELKYSTLIVIIAMVLLGIYISIVDFSLHQVVHLFSTWFQPV